MIDTYTRADIWTDRVIDIAGNRANIHNNIENNDDINNTDDNNNNKRNNDKIIITMTI